MVSIKEAVRKRYAQLASAPSSDCCAPDLYPGENLEGLEGAADASLGCGNPVAMADLAEGQAPQPSPARSHR